MKRPLALFTILFSLLLLCSCTKTLYTQQQVLQNCHTQQDVQKQFGPPDEINPGQGVSQWVYNMDKAPAQKPVKPDTTKIPIAALANDSIQVVQPDKYTKYVKFMFDDTGKVIGYKTEGVDLRREVKDSFGKSALTIAGGVLVISAVVALQLYSDGAFDF